MQCDSSKYLSDKVIDDTYRAVEHLVLYQCSSVFLTYEVCRCLKLNLLFLLGNRTDKW